MREAHGLRCRSKNRACSLKPASKSPRAKAGHDLEQDRDVIFRLARDACALDAECIQIFADARQRALVKEAGQIIGGIGSGESVT
jgi:hypothetical protein